MTPIDERFTGPALDPRLRWHEEPPGWELTADGLRLVTAAGTDFWQGTHYGFRVDNGHLLAANAEGDFVLETTVRGRPVHQYDQAGLMVRLSAEHWLKTSVEHEPGEPSRLGAVVTNHGWSDWSTQDIDPSAGAEVSFRVSRRGADYLVEAAAGGRPWSQIRIARLQADQGGPVLAGLYACSPQGAGYEALFRHLRLQPRA